MNLFRKNQEKVNSPSFILKVIFWALVVVFVLIVSYITIPIFKRYINIIYSKSEYSKMEYIINNRGKVIMNILVKL